MQVAVWDVLLGFVALWSLAASALAQSGLFQPGFLVVVTLLSALLSTALWGRRNRRLYRREIILLLALIVAATLLFMLPAEHYPILGDSAIYPNTAIALAHHGTLSYTYTPFEGLEEAEKALFYLPVTRQPVVTERSYQGLVNGVFYLEDASENRVVASRQPVVFTWMALAVLLFGPQATLMVIPLFGILGVLALYFWGRQVFGPRVGAIAAIWLLTSFPQIHFSRAPYGEIVGQVLLLGTLYAWSAYLRSSSSRYLILGNSALAAAFSARIDSVLVSVTLVFLLFILVWRRDRRGLLLSGLSLPVVVGVSVMLWSRPYISATYELLMNYQLRFLMSYTVFWAGGVLLVLTVILTLWSRKYIVSHVPLLQQRDSVAIQSFTTALKWLAIGALFLLVIYALMIRPLHEEYAWINGESYRTYNEELLAVAARYMTPLLLWLAAVGVGLSVKERRPRAEQLLSIVFLLSFSSIMFWRYTSARVYPVALRRLVSDVLPGMCLMGAVTVEQIRQRSDARRRHAIGAALVGIVFVALLAVWPSYWFYREAQGAWDVIAEIDEALPTGAVLLFEPQEQDRIAGWWATPLWAIKQRRSLVLNSWFAEDLEALETAICAWQDGGREVYLLSQRAPQAWWPLPEVPPEFTHSITWDSSIVGQSQAFPPIIWHFAFQFNLYRLGDVCE